MSKKQNRIRARRARQQQELLSLRAELVLLYDGEPMPRHYVEVDRLTTREYVRQKKWALEHDFTRRPSGAVPQNPYQAQLDIAAKQLQQDIDEQLIRSLMVGPSLDK
jgi:hypothetical protein